MKVYKLLRQADGGILRSVTKTSVSITYRIGEQMKPTKGKLFAFDLENMAINFGQLLWEGDYRYWVFECETEEIDRITHVPDLIEESPFTPGQLRDMFWDGKFETFKSTRINELTLYRIPGFNSANGYMAQLPLGSIICPSIRLIRPTCFVEDKVHRSDSKRWARAIRRIGYYEVQSPETNQGK